MPGLRMFGSLPGCSQLFAIRLLLPLLVACSVRAFAQPVPDSVFSRDRYGVYVDLGFNHHVADFRALPGVPNCCPQFQSGNGIGASFGLLYQHPLSRSFLAAVRLGYASTGGTLRALEPTTVIVGRETAPGEFEHTVQASLASWGIEPLVGFHLSRGLVVAAGGRFAMVTARNYQQKEAISQPATVGTFENGLRTRNENSGELPDASGYSGSLLLGAELDLPLNRRGTILAIPSMYYSIGLTPVVKNLIWSVNTLRLGVGIAWSPEPEPSETLATISPPGTPAALDPLNPPELTAMIDAFGVDSGVVRPDVTLRVEEFISTSMHPLLNYIFFDRNSADLSSRYQRMGESEARLFRVDALHDVETIPTYHQILNIIGRRLADHPSATITLRGCTDGQGEREDVELARGRAGVVRDYLRSVWGIAGERMKIEAGALPPHPSDESDPEGVEENRRVEISSDAREILEPVITTDTLRTTTPPLIRFQPRVRAQAGVARWSIDAAQGGRTLKQFAGTGSLPAALDWHVNDEKGSIPHAPDTINYRLVVVDSAGQERSAPAGALPVDQVTIRRKRVERIADREIDRYSLILFDFDQSELSPANRGIAEFVRGRIASSAGVTITGYTDRVGEADHNLALSEARAVNIARLLNQPLTAAHGAGESDPPYDNGTPEGRFYSRTVSIVVETPVK